MELLVIIIIIFLFLFILFIIIAIILLVVIIFLYYNRFLWKGVRHRLPDGVRTDIIFFESATDAVYLAMCFLFICTFVFSLFAERLAECGWKPHRFCFGSNKHLTGLNLLVYARNAEGYGFVELEISSSMISTAFRQLSQLRCRATQLVVYIFHRARQL